MARQHVFLQTKAGKKAIAKKPTTTKKMKPKKKPSVEKNSVLGTAGYCAQNCMRCVNCLIAKGDEENNKRINQQLNSGRPYRYY
jgi:hypothetical protein